MEAGRILGEIATAFAGVAVAGPGRRAAPHDAVDCRRGIWFAPLPSPDVVLDASASDAGTENSLKPPVAAIRATTN